MQGSLALAHGVLWVGRHEKTAHVRAYDLDGRSLGRGFSFRDREASRSEASGLAVDADHRVWVADRPASRVRLFTMFGREIGSVGGDGQGPRPLDAPLPLADPTDVALVETEDDPWLLVGSGGHRRHAARVLEPSGRLVASLRPLGDPQGTFAGVSGVAARGRFAWICEEAARRVQVFRDLEFHYALTAGTGFRPAAAAPLRDGRVVVAGRGERSGLYVFDANGRLDGVLAGPGSSEGLVRDPDGIAVEEAESDRRSRLYVLDREGERIQLFNLEGRCYGAFDDRGE